MSRLKLPNMIILFVLFFTGLKAQNFNTQSLNGVSQNQGGRILSEIMEMFAPAPSESVDRRPERIDQKKETQMFPDGWNRLLNGMSSSSNQDSIPSSLPAKTDNPWAQLTNGMLGLFQTTTRPPPTTTTEPSLFQTFYEKLNPFSSNSKKNLETSTTANILSGFTLFPTPTTTPPPSIFDWFMSNTRTTTTKAPVQALLEPFSNFLKTDKQNNIGSNGATEIDTGGPNTFDRIVIREKASRDPSDGSGLFTNILGGEKFNEKGIQWHDGNIRFVNKNGNKLLGSEVAVHDRSVDIPVTKWFRMVNELAASAYQQSQHRH